MQRIRRIGLGRQVVVSIIAITVVSTICYLLPYFSSYRVVAFLLLISVSLIACVFEMLPVLIAAALSALMWDFFFIPPTLTFRVASAEDGFLLLMYFVIALVNAVLTNRIRHAEKEALKKEGKERTLALYNTLLNSLSHELRTPIATIIAATDNLQTAGSQLNEMQRYDLLAEVSTASLRLNRQVENLLNMSRLESGYLKRKDDWTDVSELIYHVVGDIEQEKPAQHIVISIAPDLPLCRLDKGMLEQVIYNLVLNATQYTPHQTTITVSANCHTNVLKIVIADNGKGFPENEIPKVFGKFYRLDNSRAGGTGLGLSIVKGFTEAMGGDVTLTNNSDGGAHFCVSVPVETSYLKNMKNE